jgi:CDP-glucose 4,6-dehydratase
MSKILLTGASGFIGSHLVRYLTKRNYDVVAVYRSKKPYRWIKESLKGAVEVCCDITNPEAITTVVNYYRPEIVIHLAAHAIVGTSYSDLIGLYKTNVMGTVNILEACRKANVGKVLVMSTDKIFSHENAKPEDKYSPIDPYGVSKACCDLIAQNYAKNFKQPEIVVVRSCNVYGYDWNRRIVPNTIKACIKGESPTIFKNYPAKRQYVYIEDVCGILITLAEEEVGVFHIGTDDILTQEEVVLKILEYFPNIAPKYVDPPSFREVMSQSLEDSVLYPYTPFDEGIRHTIKLFEEYQDDWKKV